jgi:hypothetical protein
MTKSGPRQKLTCTRLRELLDYDQASGVFRWRVGRGCVAAGAAAGTPDSAGYLQIQIDGVNHHAHRLAVLHATGEWPRFTVDHKNGNKADNAWRNLRDVEHQVNSQNQTKAPVNSSTRLLGVSRSGARWRAYIVTSGKQRHLGCFGNPQEAHAAYVRAKRALHAGNTL